MKYWYQEQLRVLETVLREADLADYDAEKVVSYILDNGMNCIVVNAGGVMDFFPDATDFGRPNRFMNGRDFLKELIEACHREGIRVIARVDFRGVERERYEKHPDWFGQNADGTPLTGWNDRIIRPCYSAVYGREHAFEYMHNLMGRYALDGVWENCIVFGYGPCYCPKCRGAFRAATGKEIPEGPDYLAEEFKEYRTWKAGLARGHMHSMREIIKSYGEDKAYVSEIFDMDHVFSALNSGIDLYDARDSFDFLVSPLFIDGSVREDEPYEDYAHVASVIRFLKAVGPDKQCVALTGGNGTRQRYVKAPIMESRIWMWETIGAGGSLWNNYFNGSCPAEAVDRRAAHTEKEFFRFLKENRSVLGDKQPWGEVGIYYSRPSRDYCGNDAPEKDEYGTCIQGAERVLNKNHIPYRYIPDIDLSPEILKGIRVLLLTNVICMSDREIRIIRDYVAAGGSVVASYATSLRDEQGGAREDFGLRELLGVTSTGEVRDTRRDSYQLIRKAGHPLLRGMDALRTRMVANDGKTMLCRLYGSAHEGVLSFVPMIYNQPPEYAWIPEEEWETPYVTVTAGAFGSGRTVYFANQTDRDCRMHPGEDPEDLYANAVLWALGSKPQMTAKAPESVHISVTAEQREDGTEERVISFINLTAGPWRPVREVIPVRDLEVRMKGKLAAARLLYGSSEMSVSDEGGEIVIRIAELGEFASCSVALRPDKDL